MSISYDAGSTGPDSVAVSSITWNHTCTGAGILFVTAASADFDTVSSVTYNGVSLTKIVSVQNSLNGGWVSLWRLYNPTSGSHAIVVNSSSPNELLGCANSYIGSTILDAVNAVFTQSLPLTVIANGSWVIAAQLVDVIYPTGDGNTTTRQSLYFGVLTGDSGGPKPPGATSLGCSSGSVFAGIIASFAPTSDSFFSAMETQSVKKKQTVANF